MRLETSNMRNTTLGQMHTFKTWGFARSETCPTPEKEQAERFFEKLLNGVVLPEPPKSRDLPEWAPYHKRFRTLRGTH